MKKLIVVSLFSLLSTVALAQPLVAVIDTERGVMRAELNERAAPTTVANFVNLAMRGFYDGLTFHRVERNFMAQGGDPWQLALAGLGIVSRVSFCSSIIDRACFQWLIQAQALTAVSFSSLILPLPILMACIAYLAEWWKACR